MGSPCPVLPARQALSSHAREGPLMCTVREGMMFKNINNLRPPKVLFRSTCFGRNYLPCVSVELVRTVFLIFLTNFRGQKASPAQAFGSNKTELLPASTHPHPPPMASCSSTTSSYGRTAPMLDERPPLRPRPGASPPPWSRSSFKERTGSMTGSTGPASGPGACVKNPAIATSTLSGAYGHDSNASRTLTHAAVPSCVVRLESRSSSEER